MLSHLSESHTSTYQRPIPSTQLAHSHWAECIEPACSEQLHLMLAGPSEIFVSFVSSDSSVASEVVWWSDDQAASTAVGNSEVYSMLMYIDPQAYQPQMGDPTLSMNQIIALQNTSSWAFDPFTGERGTNYLAPKDAGDVKWFLGPYNNPQMFYDSPYVHTVALRDLKPGKEYGYRVAGDPRNHTFVMPLEPHTQGRAELAASLYPFTFAVTADMGQTAVSLANVRLLQAMLEAAEPGRGVLLQGGDLSYADGFHPRWDSYGRMIEPLASRFTQLTIAGNHEFLYGEAWVAYNARYKSPFRSSGSHTNLWWSRDVGPAHVIGLCSYSSASVGSLQYEWLAADLHAVDRSRTPWIILMTHVPWYTSNLMHIAEAELTRRAIEPLLYNFGVDLVISGHVHAYERIKPVYKGCSNYCGPSYINIGDGGNREGASPQWTSPQPEWSAFREASFGVGGLQLVNDTHAYFTWTRSACEGSSEPDHINFNRTCESISWGLWAGHDSPGMSSERSDSAWIVRKRSGRDECPASDAPMCTLKVQSRTAPSPSPSDPARDDGAHGNPTFLTLSMLSGVVFGFIGGLLTSACVSARFLWHGNKKVPTVMKPINDKNDQDYIAWPHRP